jgi:hypothetical protein
MNGATDLSACLRAASPNRSSALRRNFHVVATRRVALRDLGNTPSPRRLLDAAGSRQLRPRMEDFGLIYAAIVWHFMTTAEKQAWEKIRAKGVTHYILTTGCLRAALLIFPQLLVFAIFPRKGSHIIPTWGLLLIGLVLTVPAGIAFGLLFWNLLEKRYALPADDVATPGSSLMDKDEFRVLDRKLGRRFRMRGLLLLAVPALLLTGASMTPSGSTERTFYLGSLLLGSVALAVAIIAYVARATKADCIKFGAVCPGCNKPLFGGLLNVEKGRCPNCGHQLFDDGAPAATAPAKAG